MASLRAGWLAGWVFLLLSTGAILIAYLNMKFVGLARTGPAGLEKLVIQTATHQTGKDWYSLTYLERYFQFSNEKAKRKF